MSTKTTPIKHRIIKENLGPVTLLCEWLLIICLDVLYILDIVATYKLYNNYVHKNDSN